MSEKNGKVCCNCRRNIRINKGTYIECQCDVDKHYIGYIECMEGWCRHWAKEHKWESEVTEDAKLD